ncbi:sigma-70 family RNA polymerase sigma factor [Heliobacterium chlorum]|uniref:Sigma-70 family RNA polymerase sigma factor n=1 Tax=Heliobacterium chlorum TaxID=2698 RepID=A0ABR7SZ58_HELCL|nr:sigma-70 family RNA polymerase sigma factor [Heliobacterium chlorum]MBC9783142.1 sigma-70 family RNA polymerase sigma factor [Heliobacterium chlorum]
MDDLLNEAFIERCKSGDKEALSTLLATIQKPVYNLCLRLLQHREDARDAAQESLILICRAIPQFRGHSKFSTWAYRLATNHCIDRMRKRKWATVPLEPHAEVHSEGAIPWRGDGPEGELIRKETGEKVREAIAALPEHYRTVVALYHLDDLTYSEIADVLNLPKKTVETRLYRAKVMLRESLRDLSEKGGPLP